MIPLGQGYTGRNGEEKQQAAKERARAERLDILAGTRGNAEDHALRRKDLNGDIADLIQRMIVAELDKRGL